MDEQTIRTRADALCQALLAGDVGKASEQMSNELRSNLGPVVAMLPMPLTGASVESVEMARTGWLATLRLVGEGTIRLQTRWKDRDGTLTVVEVSHIPDEPVQAQGEPDSEEPGMNAER